MGNGIPSRPPLNPGKSRVVGWQNGVLIGFLMKKDVVTNET